MKLMVLILNKTDALEYLLEGLSAAGIGGATIIPSSGMAMTLSKMNSSFLSSSIRSMFSGEEDDNKTIISVIENDQLDLARRVVYNTVGDLSQPNTGIMFTIPLDFVEGRRKRRTPVPERADKEENKDKKSTGEAKKGKKDR
ncbi:hypothetical protein [Ruminococcus albus]|uniref:hypothetical protein n=1 Tax=Ruminococcus albus TaxID=1264 RepID=UPI0004638963|nr:hypothetical protein [Ruminococcus albus]